MCIVRGRLDALDASDAEDAMLDALEDRGIEDGWRYAEPLATVRPRRGLGRPRAGHRRPGDGEDPCVGGGLADRARAGVRARRVHRAHVRPGQGDQDLRLHGPRRRRARRRPRRPREHAGDARPQAQAHADQGHARLRQDAAAADDVRLRAQPGLDEPARQRDRRAGRGRGDHDHDELPTTAASRSTSPTTGPASREEARPHIFDPFFTTKAPGSGTGMGLDTARRIVEQRHCGSITFDTGDGGTVFHVWLPLDGVKK